MTDPVDAGLVESLEKPGKNVTGSSDMNPIEEQIELVKELLPEAKKIVLVYNNSEPNSVIQINIARVIAVDLGFEVFEVVVTDASNIRHVVSQLIQNSKADAFILQPIILLLVIWVVWKKLFYLLNNIKFLLLVENQVVFMVVLL